MYISESCAYTFGHPVIYNYLFPTMGTTTEIHGSNTGCSLPLRGGSGGGFHGVTIASTFFLALMEEEKHMYYVYVTCMIVI